MEWMTPEQVTCAGFYLTWTEEDHSTGASPEVAEVWQSPQGFVVRDGRGGVTRLAHEAYHGVMFSGPVVYSREPAPTTFVDPYTLYPHLKMTGTSK